MTAKERLESYLVEVNQITFKPGEKCFFSANGRIYNGTKQSVTTTSKPSGLGLGVVVPVTKHFGIGVSRHKVKTTTTVETHVDYTPCHLYMTSERYVIDKNGSQETIAFDKIKGQKLYADSLELKYGLFGKLVIQMAHSDLQRFKELSEAIADAAKEGVDLNSLTEYKKETVEKGSSGGLNYEISYNRAVKPLQGDYAKTLFLWAFSRKASPIHARDEYPQYLFYDCGIQNAPKYHQELIQQGYFRQATPEEILGTYKVDQLKEMLANNGLESKGKKKDLISCILESIPEAVEKENKETLYVLSDNGRAFLDSHEDCVKLHSRKNWQISWDTYRDAKKKVKNGTFFDVCWDILNRRLITDPKMMHLNRNNYLALSELLHDEGRFSDELEYLLRVLYCDMNDRDRFFAPALVKSIGDLSEYYDPLMIDRVCRDVKLSSVKMNAERFGGLVGEIMTGTLNEGKYVRNKT